MKKVFIIMIGCLILTGCGKYDMKDAFNDFSKKIDDDSYYLEGNLEIVNDENIYNYDVKVSYKKEDYYKVSLINTSNSHEQIILKNKEGVYVLTLRSLQQKII